MRELKNCELCGLGIGIYHPQGLQVQGLGFIRYVASPQVNGIHSTACRRVAGRNREGTTGR